MIQRLQNKKLRQWQQENLPKFVQRRQQGQKTEVTVAYQGSGKTLYAAACYVASIRNDTNLSTQTISTIRESFLIDVERFSNFVVVFIPSKSIANSTIRDWGELGIKLIAADNAKLRKTSPEKMIRQGINGLVLTYAQAKIAQAIPGSYVTDGFWRNNILVSWRNRSSHIKIHAILDEAHNLTTTIVDKGESFANLNAKFFINNHSIFNTLHLMSGTLVKKKYETQ